jgi:hypothetical protein
MERQRHGFDYEKEVCLRYNIQKRIKRNEQWDGWIDNTPVMIVKCKVGTEISLSDLFKVCDIQQDFYLIVGMWEDIPTKTCREYICKYLKDLCMKIFVKTYSHH